MIGRTNAVVGGGPEVCTDKPTLGSDGMWYLPASVRGKNISYALFPFVYSGGSYCTVWKKNDGVWRVRNRSNGDTTFIEVDESTGKMSGQIGPYDDAFIGGMSIVLYE